MELDPVYQNVGLRNTKDTFKPRTLNHGQDEGKHKKHRGSRCLVLMTVCLGLICVLLLVFIIFITAERESLFKSYKNTIEEINQTINSLQDNYTDLTQKKLELETRVNNLTAEKSQLQNNFSSLSQKKLELETRVNNLSAEKSQLQNNFSSMSQKKMELETRVNNLSAEKSQLQNNFNSLSQKKMELETRVNNLSAEKSQLQNNFNSLSQKKMELETRVNNLSAEKSQLQNNFSSLSQKKLELETRVNNLSAEKSQLQNNFNSLSQKKMELETRVNNLSAEKSQLQRSFDALSQKNLQLESKVRSLSDELLSFFFISRELKSWSESRKYCRDRGADLVIIKTEEKQRFISSIIKDRVWIGLSDSETEGRMKWVDNKPLDRGFWSNGEPNNKGDEDCVELIPTHDPGNNWNDVPCSDRMKGICEKN